MEKQKNKTIVAIALALILTISTLIAIAPTNTANAQDDYGDLMQYEWPENGADSSKTHFSAGPAPSSPDILWQKKINRASYPIAFNDMVFVTASNYIIAMEPFTGNIIYNVSIPVIPDVFGFAMNLFKMDETRMGVTFLAGPLFAYRCFNIADGALLWSQDPQICGGPSMPAFGYVIEEKMDYVAIGNATGRGSRAAYSGGILQAWDFSDPTKPPTLAWEYLSDGAINTGHYGDGKVFPDGNSPHQVCLDARTGEILWDAELTGVLFYAGTYDDGKLYRGLLDNTFVALDGETGELLWSYNPHSYGFWASGSSAGYGMVYMLNVDGHLYALDANTGQVVWKYKGPGLAYTGHVNIADGKVYACTGQVGSPLTPETATSEFSCLDAYTGKVLWQVKEEFSAGHTDYACIAYGNFYGVNRKRVGSDPILSLICYGPPKDWSMFLGDPQHTAIRDSGPTDATFRWKFQTNGAVVSSPAVVSGKVYVGSFDKNLYCLDARDGSKIWNFTTGFRIRSSPAVVDGKVYTGADDGYVYCLDADTGQQLWKTAAPGSILHIMTGTVVEYRGSPTVVGGKVYIGSLDGKLYCLNANTGGVIWTKRTTGSIISTPTYIFGDGLYFASVDGVVYKLDAYNGNVIWNQSTPIGVEIAMMGSPAVADGMVFIGSGAASASVAGIGQFYCLNATTGEFIWTTDQLPGSGSLEPIWSMLYLDGKVYHGDFFSFTCTNATTGEKLWSSFLTREHYGSPAYADGKFYVPSDSFGVYIVNATSGQKMDYFGPVGQVESSVAIWENKLYFGSLDWNVYCLEETSTGTVYYGTSATTASATEQTESTPVIPAQPPETQPLPTIENTAAVSINMYLIVAAVAVVAVIVAAAIFLQRRRK